MLPVLSSGSLSKLLHLSYAPSSSHLPSQFNLKTSLSHSLLLQNISHSFLLCSLLKLPENFPLLTLFPSLSLCFLQKLSLLHPSNSRTPQNIFLFFSSVTQLFFSRICPSNHICRDSLLPAPLLCSLPKALLQRPDNLLHAAGFSPSNNSQKWFLSDSMMTRVDPRLAFKSTTLIPWWPIREWHVAKYAAANQAPHGGLQFIMHVIKRLIQGF